MVSRTFQFIYFSYDYGHTHTEGFTQYYGRKEPGLVFRHAYKKKDSPRYRAAERKAFSGGETYFKHLAGQLKYFLRYIPAFIMALTAILCLISLLGVDLTSAYVSVWDYVEMSPYKILLMLAAVPVVAVMFIPFLLALLLNLLAASKGTVAMIIALLVLAGISVAAYYLIKDMVRARGCKWGPERRRRAEAKKYANSEEYAAIMAQEEEYERLSLEWHRKWYDYIKSRWDVTIT